MFDGIDTHYRFSLLRKYTMYGLACQLEK